MKLLEAKFGQKGYVDAPALRTVLDSLGKASRNLVPMGRGQLRAFRGLSLATGGARRMFPFRDGWAGLDDVAAQAGRGSVFASLFGMCVYAGNGQLSIDGVDISGALATSIVRLLLRWNGVYTATESGPYIAGIPEPAAPTVVVLDTASSIVPNVTGSLTFRIAGYRTTTGGRSRSSAMSEIVIPTNQPVALKVPIAPDGLTHWAFFATELGAGGQGTHKRLTRPNPYTNTEYLEEEIQREVTVTATNGSASVTAAAGTFEDQDVGKRFDKISGTPTFPNPTVIVEVVSDTQVTLSNVATGSGSVVADLIAYAGGVDRQVIVNYSESDLAAEFAWIDDFAPPPVSHIGELGTHWVYFTGGDAASNVNSDSGTIAQFSNRNNLESVNPIWRVYLPAAVVDVLSRGIDSYMFIGFKTMIIAMQYIDTIEGVPAVTNVILQNEGIASPNNWCLRLRALYLFTSECNAVRITENGQIDQVFSQDVQAFMRVWVQADVVVGSHPNGKSVVYAYGRISLIYSEETGEWSSRCYLPEGTAQNRTFESMVTTSQGLLCSLDDGTNRFAYRYDYGSSTEVVVACTEYQAVNEQFPACVESMFANCHNHITSNLLFAFLQRNFAPQFGTDGAISAFDNTFTSSQITFTSEMVGYYLLLVSTNEAGGVYFGRIVSINGANSVEIGTPVDDLSTSAPLAALDSVSNAFFILAYKAWQIPNASKGIKEIVNTNLYLPGCFSLAAGVMMRCVGNLEEAGMPLNVSIDGFIDPVRGYQPKF